MAKGNTPAKPVAGSSPSKKQGSSLFSFLKNSSNKHLLYSKTNYILFGLGFCLVIFGFILMAGGGSSDPNVFNKEEIYSTRRITIAPIVIISGFIIVAIGTLLKPGNSAE